MVEDILHRSPEQIATMEYIDHQTVINYAVTTYKLRCMAESKKQPTGDTTQFDQPDDYDLDPNFVSKVN